MSLFASNSLFRRISSIDVDGLKESCTVEAFYSISIIQYTASRCAHLDRGAKVSLKI